MAIPPADSSFWLDVLGGTATVTITDLATKILIQRLRHEITENSDRRESAVIELHRFVETHRNARPAFEGQE